ncbi:RNA polymerase sigma factor FliA [Agaribacter marinus]|uniref:RNA polymerase sigma factor FliA n=2 Tax=Agaribacter marinus TaxID=1431249 RepID=A0AA37WJP3_9ALTE|nr:RNA polymerase sigma factor FliA [Agaribacter marinus]
MERISIPISSINWIGHIEKWPNKTTSDWGKSRINLFNSHAKWARAIGLKVFGMYRIYGVDVNDYINFANLGLLESIDSYNPGKGATFRSYAFKRIKGAILSGIIKYTEYSQSTDWIRRRMKERMRSITNDKPQNDDIELIENIIALTIGFILEDNALMITDTRLSGTYFDSQELVVLQGNIKKVVDELPHSQQEVMSMHYYELKSFSEIAEIRNCSIGRVSQLHAQGVKNIRKKLTWE